MLPIYGHIVDVYWVHRMISYHIAASGVGVMSAPLISERAGHEQSGGRGWCHALRFLDRL